MVKRSKLIGFLLILAFLLVVLLISQGGIATANAGLTGGRAAVSMAESQDSAGSAASTIVRLTGEWLELPGGIDGEFALPSPQDWQAAKQVDLQNPGIRFSLSPDFDEKTYFCALATPGVRGDMALRIPRIYSAYRLWINGEERHVSGFPGGSVGSEIPGGYPVVLPFFQDSDELVIVLSLSNWHSYSPGFAGNVPEYGKFDTLSRRDENQRSLSLLFIAFLFSFVIVAAIWYFQYRNDNFYFFLAAIFLLFVLQRAGAGIFASPLLARALGWAGFFRAGLVLNFLLVPLLLSFTRSVYPSFLPGRRLLYAAVLPAALLSLTVILLPGEILPWIEISGPLYISAGLAGCLVPALRRLKKEKKRLSFFFLLGIISLLLGALGDCAFFLGLLPRQGFFLIAEGLFSLCCLVLLFAKEGLIIKNAQAITSNLEEVVEGRDTMLLELSNEVGGSLDSVIELLRTLNQGSQGTLNSEQLVSTTLVLARAMHHQDLINDSLDILRLREGELEINKGEVKLYSLLLMYLHSFASILRSRNLKLSHEIDREIPYVYGDEKRLGQVLNIFLFFGVQQLEKGEIKITISQKGNDRVFVQFLFSGELREASIESLIRRLKGNFSFKDIQNWALPEQRFLLAQELIRLNGGELKIEHEPEKTLTLSFSLPVYKTEEEEAVILSEEVASPIDVLDDLRPLLEEVPSERDISIMVCCGDPYNLQILKNQLASMNYRVIPEIEGMGALERITQELPDMVIIDSELSDMSGYAVCREIREQYTASDLPVIMIIEEKQASDVMESLTSGANDYIRRPYQQEEFLTRVNTHLQLNRISSVYSQFVPKEFLRCLGQDNIADVKLGDQVQQEMTILFVDIRAFTNLSENMTPQENFKFINSYLSQFTPIITRNGGFVDKYIGDAIMALYPQRPEDAIITAIEMIEYVKVYNGYRANVGYVPINIGIGIHTGNLILGIIGDSQRMQGTVISDAVNLASRIQDVTKLYRANIVISQETFVKLDNPMQFNFRFLGKVKVKGKAKSVSLFEIFNADDDELKKLKEETKSDFETGILLFAKRDFEAAEEHFVKVLAKNPQDDTAKLFLDRAQKFLSAKKHSFLTSI